MVNMLSENFHEILWDSIPYPSFVISSSNEILAANTSAEDYCLSSVKHIQLKPVESYFGENSVIISAINQARESVAICIFIVDYHFITEHFYITLLTIMFSSHFLALLLERDEL